MLVLMVVIVSVIWIINIISGSPESAVAGNKQDIPSPGSPSVAGTAQKGPSAPLAGKANDRIANRLKTDVIGDKNNIDESLNMLTAAEQTAKTVKILESHLNLAAIISGNSPQAFINDSLYKTGDKIDISDGNLNYECVIKKINESEVVIECLGNEISLKIANPDEVIENL